MTQPLLSPGERRRDRASSLVRAFAERESPNPELHNQLKRNFASMKKHMQALEQFQRAKYEEAFQMQRETHEKAELMPTIRISQKNPARQKLRALISKRVSSPPP